MKRMGLACCSAVLCLALAACGGQPTPTPAPVETPVPSAAPAALEFADQFERWNDMLELDGLAADGFRFSEGEWDGAPCYRMENRTYGVTILAVPGGKAEPYQAMLTCGDRVLAFEMPIFPLGYGNVSGVASLALSDLTGDGIPELVYIYGGGGTGVWQDEVQIFDLAAMVPCPVEMDLSLLENAVQLRLAEVRDDGAAVFAVTGPGGAEILCAAGVDRAKLPAKLSQGVPARFGSYNSISLQDGQLVLSALFSPEELVPFCYLGSLEGGFVYADGAFTLAPPFSLTVNEPVEP